MKLLLFVKEHEPAQPATDGDANRSVYASASMDPQGLSIILKKSNCR